MEARQIVGWNLRRIRAEKGLTIEELGHEAGVDASSVARIERGTANPSIGVIEKLGRALGVSLVQLLTEPEAGEVPPKPLPAGRRKAR
ncbi:helix-turn-helix domain-containing protein [Thalassobaculum litoreum]|uniref:Helix-turn-helix n=1 Tax=Thalassobaculum litoreum DSM 18839 TaxID=1123362 RepID=A0A8G2BHY1_9PROT|nr:helix-turn-helix transcriptional regulator [Thalassobaculum litoreum]SDF82439.1 Helix-turn-helix [Thalassobaculum litoreum DSM 18839]